MGTVAERIKKIEAECSGVWSSYGVTSWERQRLDEWKSRTSLSAKQEDVLKQIETKVFGEAECDDVAKRLRAEGHELKRLRKLIVESDATSGWWSTEEMAERGVKVMDALQREAARIQKARKAK